MDYDVEYPWRPRHAFDQCPACFEVWDFDFKCDNCGSGHTDEQPE